MNRYSMHTTPRQRRIVLEQLRGELGDRLFADFVVHALMENPNVPVTRWPSLAALWLRGLAVRLGRDDLLRED